jgi:predicted phosphodiesterase
MAGGDVEGWHPPPVDRLGRLVPHLLPLLAGAVVAVALLGLVSPLAGDVGPGTVELRAAWSVDHRTDLRFPPLGRVSADTHEAPLGLSARVDRIDIDEVRRLADIERPGEALADQAQRDLRPLLLRFSIRAVLLAAVVGALTGAVLPRRSWRHVGLGAVGGAVSVGLLMGMAALTYDPRAFAQPRFEGPLAEAPRIVETVQGNIEDFDEVRSRIDVLGAQLGELYASSVDERLPSEAGEVRILHVSDIHLNPVGLEIAGELAERFDAHAVLDTGDLTSFGLPFESRIGELIEDMPVPYYVVPGNHDSPRNRQGLERFDNVRVLDGEVATIRDLRILGVADPSFTATNEVDEEEVMADLEAQQPEVRTLVRQAIPDVLAVHNRRQADLVLGEIPLVLAGHIHEHTVEDQEGTLVITAGSTGATGLGSFTVDTDLPYEASLLRFVDGELRIVDSISLRGTGGEFRLDRRIVGE